MFMTYFNFNFLSNLSNGSGSELFIRIRQIKSDDKYHKIVIIAHPLVGLPHVAGEVIHRDILVTVGAPGLLTQVNALNIKDS